MVIVIVIVIVYFLVLVIVIVIAITSFWVLLPIYGFCLINTVKIKEHCLELRTGVDLATELKIKQIKEFQEQAILEIDQFEKECIKDLSKLILVSFYINKCIPVVFNEFETHL